MESDNYRVAMGRVGSTNSRGSYANAHKTGAGAPAFFLERPGLLSRGAPNPKTKSASMEIVAFDLKTGESSFHTSIRVFVKTCLGKDRVSDALYAKLKTLTGVLEMGWLTWPARMDAPSKDTLAYCQEKFKKFEEEKSVGKDNA